MIPFAHLAGSSYCTTTSYTHHRPDKLTSGRYHPFQTPFPPSQCHLAISGPHQHPAVIGTQADRHGCTAGTHNPHKTAVTFTEFRPAMFDQYDIHPFQPSAKQLFTPFSRCLRPTPIYLPLCDGDNPDIPYLSISPRLTPAHVSGNDFSHYPAHHKSTLCIDNALPEKQTQYA